MSRGSSTNNVDQGSFLQRLYENGVKIAKFANITDLEVLLKIFLCHYAGVRLFSQINWVLGALLYCVCPIDLIPDFIPVIGFLDDMAAVSYVMHKLKAEITSFKAWEAGLAVPLSTSELFEKVKTKFKQDTKSITQKIFDYFMGLNQQQTQTHQD